MKAIRVIGVMLAIAAVLAGCQKSADDLQKERQEKIIREAAIKGIEQGAAFQEAAKRPSNLNGAFYDPSKQKTSNSKADAAQGAK